MAEKSFADGYTDGWHSVKPGTDPDIPAHAIPVGKTDYEHGYKLGRARALGCD